MTAVAAGTVVAALAAGAVLLRSALRRSRRIRRLRLSEAAVASAVEKGRIHAATGQALLQHLAGLRRECSGGSGDR